MILQAIKLTMFFALSILFYFCWTAANTAAAWLAPLITL